MDVIRRLREPAAWLLLAAVFVAAVTGIVDLLSGLSSPAGFPLAAAGASSNVLDVTPVAMSFFAVLLATKFGPVLERARPIVIGALVAQGLTALVGVIAWLGALFGGLFSTTPAGVAGVAESVPSLLLRFLEGGIFLALLGLAGFYTITVLKTPELAPKPKPQPAPQHGFGAYPGAPGGYPGMQPGPQMGQPGQMGQTGQQQPYGPPPGQPGYPSGQQAPMAGYPSGQQQPMPGYQPQEYGRPDSTSQMPSVGDPEETHNFGAQSGPQQPFAQPGYASGPQPGYPAPSEPAGSGPQFAPPPGPAAQPGWPGDYGQQSGPQQPQPPQAQPGQGWPGGFGQEPPQAPDPYGHGGFGQPAPSGPGAFGQQPEAPSPYQEPPSPYQEPPQYETPGFGQEPSPFGGTPQPEPQQPAAGEQQNGGFDALFGGRPDADEPDDVQRTSRIEHDPEAFRRYQQPPSDQ